LRVLRKPGSPDARSSIILAQYCTILVLYFSSISIVINTFGPLEAYTYKQESVISKTAMKKNYLIKRNPWPPTFVIMFEIWKQIIYDIFLLK